MNFLEKDLEDIIWENQKTQEGRAILAERGLVVSGKAYRQYNLGEYGKLDLATVAISKRNRYARNNFSYLYKVQVFELKRDKIDAAAVAQALRYKAGINHLFDLIAKKHDFQIDYYDIDFEINLIGRSIADDAIWIIAQNSCVHFYKYKFDLVTGLEFDDKEYDNTTRYNHFSPDLNFHLPRPKEIITESYHSSNRMMVPY